MAVEPAIPQNVVLSLIQGVTQEVKFVPKAPDGTVLDCTGFSANPSMNIYVNSRIANASFFANITPTVIVADATGITFSFDPAMIQTILDSIGANAAWYNLTTEDATPDNLNVGYGVLNVVPTAMA